MIVIAIPLEKGWVREYRRKSKYGKEHRVSGYWRNEKKPIERKSYQDYGLPRWEEVMKNKSPAITKRLHSADEVEAYLKSLQHVFLVNKDGWTMVPTADKLYASIEPGLYQHWVEKYGIQEADRRLSYFPAVIDTLIKPWEIWRQPVGKAGDDGRLFLKVFSPEDDLSTTVMVLVAFRANKPIIWTVIPTTRFKEVDKRRWGELLFSEYGDEADD
ncbi:PBECR2 nuclease fold domain-containing protein [Alicyclobacillus sendaiensis]|uniref:PBECR2 nuclease fold domain-containing protein n=1 Tax=Alicyclobacillus sendaiensis TaxID=192387 RepID=UPI0026F46AB3|nr:PBECR2 nuclease fold domain-containing protein [Alicyclobacillus sendaiensis]